MENGGYIGIDQQFCKSVSNWWYANVISGCLWQRKRIVETAHWHLK